MRERLPRKRNSKTFSFRVADCEGYVTVGEYEDGRPGEVFIKVSKQGSTLAGIMDAFSISLSLGLQHGVPLATFVRKFANMKFEPAGITDDPELRIATSLIDYIFRRLALDFLPVEERTELGILSTQERTQPTLPGVEEMATPSVGLVDDGLSTGAATVPGAAAGSRRSRWPGPSSSTRRSATAAATPCSGPARATSAGAAGRPAGARSENSRSMTSGFRVNMTPDFAFGDIRALTAREGGRAAGPLRVPRGSVGVGDGEPAALRAENLPRGPRVLPSQCDQRRVFVDKRELGEPQLGKHPGLTLTRSPSLHCRLPNSG